MHKRDDYSFAININLIIIVCRFMHAQVKWITIHITYIF